MEKIGEVKGYVRITSGKLPGIRADLVRLEDDWLEWDVRAVLRSSENVN